MSERAETRDVGPLQREAAFGTVDREKRTVEVIWSTGAAVMRSSWLDGPFFEELSMSPGAVRLGRLQSGKAPFLQDHESGNVAAQLGVIESARIVKGQGIALVRFAPDGIDLEADKVFEKIAAGIIRNVSVGYRTWKIEKTSAVDEKIPTMRAIDWEPLEVSAVSIGADAGAGTRAERTITMNPCVISTRGSDNRRAPMEKPEVVNVQDIAQNERERVEGIRAAVRTARLGDDFATRLISSGAPLTDARSVVLDVLAARSEETAIQGHHGTGIERGEEDRDKWARGAVAGLLSRSGMLPMLATVAAGVKGNTVKIPGVRSEFRHFDEFDTGGDFQRYTLLDLAAESLERRGVKTRGMTKEKLVGEAFTRSGGQSTQSDFAVVLENVLNKTLLGSYAQASDTWRRFCGTDTTEDFRPSNRYRTGSFGTLDVIEEGGEFKSKAIPDGLKFALTMETRGNMIALSRAAIINDDLGALTETAGKFGRMAGLSIEKSVYELLLQNGGLGPNITINGVTHPLFDAAWGNVGAGAALSMASIEADRVLMASQKDISNNEYLDLKPRTLLVPVGLEGEANLINRAKFDPTAASAMERPNIVGGLFSDVVGSPRISGTRRYMFTDPGSCAAIVVAFLNGTQSPFMDQQIGWRVDGTEWKLRIDFKAQAFDPKGGVVNAGA